MATLLDLAQRGVISITEDSKPGFFSSEYDCIYRMEGSTEGLDSFEQKLLHAIFGGQQNAASHR